LRCANPDFLLAAAGPVAGEPYRPLTDQSPVDGPSIKLRNRSSECSKRSLQEFERIGLTQLSATKALAGRVLAGRMRAAPCPTSLRPCQSATDKPSLIKRIKVPWMAADRGVLAVPRLSRLLRRYRLVPFEVLHLAIMLFSC
jgi:hypothetical protein